MGMVHAVLALASRRESSEAAMILWVHLTLLTDVGYPGKELDLEQGAFLYFCIDIR